MVRKVGEFLMVPPNPVLGTPSGVAVVTKVYQPGEFGLRQDPFAPLGEVVYEGHMLGDDPEWWGWFTFDGVEAYA